MSGLGAAAGMVRPRVLRKAVAGRRTGRRLLVRAVLVAAVAAGGIGVVDAQNVALQKPAECGQGQVAVAVPRPHMWPVTSLPGMSGPGPHLRDVMASQAPQVALTDVIRANPGLGVADPMGDLPRAAGGRVCVQLPAVAKVAPSSLVLQGPAVAQETVTAEKVRLVPLTGRRRLTDREIASVAWRAGFRGRNLVIAVAVAKAESGGDSKARCRNRNGSTDRGLWQINTVHRWVSNAEADNPTTAARAAWKISAHGRTWRPWVTFWRGSYKKHLPAAQRAVNQIGA